MPLTVIGPRPFEADPVTQQKPRIGTLFLSEAVLFTEAPAVHAWQRLRFLELTNDKRAAARLQPLTELEAEAVCANSVDLVIDSDCILIRPDPANMGLALAADELLQEQFSKRRIRFLLVSDPKVRSALERRGENWRLSTLPKSAIEIEHWFANSKVSIGGLPLYYYNSATGTRWLTLQNFEMLALQTDVVLAKHLQEIANHLCTRNRLGRPELELFAADRGIFDLAEFGPQPFTSLPADQLRAAYSRLKDRFRSLVPSEFVADNPQNPDWRQRMLATLFLQGDDTQFETASRDLSPEFFLQIAWLPGGRFEEGEFIFDPVFEEVTADPESEKKLGELCDLSAKGIIFNMIREHGDLEYINIGHVTESLSEKRPQKRGRRGVYIAEFKSRSEPQLIRRLIRLQKWGVQEHLDEGKDLLQAIKESDEYTDYFLDRRLGCRQLGMYLTQRVVMRRLTETYHGSNPRYQNELIRTFYFEREFLGGTATDKITLAQYARGGYANKLATLLGEAGAASIIVGRALEDGKVSVFDDGDELVCEDEAGLPNSILVADHSGAFGEYTRPLEAFAADYARPVNGREGKVDDLKTFAELYLRAFAERFAHIQSDYRKRRRAFDTLFKHCHYDEGGSFAYRWKRVLARLDATDGRSLVAAIRRHIRVLNPEAAPALVSAQLCELDDLLQHSQR